MNEGDKLLYSASCCFSCPSLNHVIPIGRDYVGNLHNQLRIVRGQVLYRQSAPLPTPTFFFRNKEVIDKSCMHAQTTKQETYIFRQDNLI